MDCTKPLQGERIDPLWGWRTTHGLSTFWIKADKQEVTVWGRPALSQSSRSMPSNEDSDRLRFDTDPGVCIDETLQIHTLTQSGEEEKLSLWLYFLSCCPIRGASPPPRPDPEADVTAIWSPSCLISKGHLSAAGGAELHRWIIWTCCTKETTCWLFPFFTMKWTNSCCSCYTHLYLFYHLIILFVFYNIIFHFYIYILFYFCYHFFPFYKKENIKLQLQNI